MIRFKNRLLPHVVDAFFSKVTDIRHYNTRSASKQSYSLPRVRIMVNSALDFKDQIFGIQLMTILNLPPLHNLEQI